jgi:hypothetical protein
VGVWREVIDDAPNTPAIHEVGDTMQPRFRSAALLCRRLQLALVFLQPVLQLRKQLERVVAQALPSGDECLENSIGEFQGPRLIEPLFRELHEERLTDGKGE